MHSLGSDPTPAPGWTPYGGYVVHLRVDTRREKVATKEKSFFFSRKPNLEKEMNRTWKPLFLGLVTIGSSVVLLFLTLRSLENHLIC